MPEMGCFFYGYATYGGSALSGKTIVATNADNSVSATTNSNGYYHLDIARCPGTSASVTFTVCTRSAAETGTYVGGGEVEQNLTISSACPTTAAPSGGGGTSGGGGGGGGGGVSIPSVINLDLKSDFSSAKGYTAKQTQGDTVTFTINGKKYTIKVTSLRSDSVTITVDGQSVVLKIGGSTKFDVDGDGVADISVQLLSIEGGRAEILYKSLAEGGMMALLNTIRDFYSGESTLTMMELLDIIRAFYGG